MIRIKGINSFQWSTNEQLWPLEKHTNGKDIYCKLVNYGNRGSSGLVAKAHGISGIDQLIRYEVLMDHAPGTPLTTIGMYPQSHPAYIGDLIYVYANTTNCVTYNNTTSYNSYPFTFRMYYTKN